MLKYLENLQEVATFCSFPKERTYSSGRRVNSGKLTHTEQYSSRTASIPLSLQQLYLAPAARWHILLCALDCER